MPQLKLTFSNPTPFDIPIAYNHQLQSAFARDLHSQGYGSHSTFKLFTFGRIFGEYTVPNKTISIPKHFGVEVHPIVATT